MQHRVHMIKSIANRIVRLHLANNHSAQKLLHFVNYVTTVYALVYKSLSKLTLYASLKQDIFFN